jgi:hypothetical protein
LSFFIKGPDLFGAKTHAFILGDFTGIWGSPGPGESLSNSSNYGAFDLVMANMVLEWPNTSLLIGQAPMVIGPYPTVALVASWNQASWGNNRFFAPVTTEIVLSQKVTKELKLEFGIVNPYDGTNSTNNMFQTTGSLGDQNQDTRATVPVFQGAVNYESDACGKVGPWNLKFSLAAIWGQEKYISGDQYGFVPMNANGTLSDKNISVWDAYFKWMIPIIPEKNMNKTGALLFDGSVSMSQAANSYTASAGLPPYDTGPYLRPDGDIATPVLFGTLGHAQYYFTNDLSINGFYEYASNSGGSTWWAQNVASNVFAPYLGLGMGMKNASSYIANLMWEPNPALRFVLEFDDTRLNFASHSAIMDNVAVQDQYRFAAYYFF